MKKSLATWGIQVILLSLLPLCGRGQTLVPPSLWQVDTLIVVRHIPFVYTLPQTHRPQWQTLRIKRNRVVLQRDADFFRQQDTIHFYAKIAPGDSLRIRYKRLPFNLPRTLRLFAVDSLQNKQTIDSLKLAGKAVGLRRIRFENPFIHLNEGGLHTTGSIMRGIQVGTNRDFTLNSGLNLQLSGRLTDNVQIIAALTDEATPIQPEGNTKTLQEVDKVFVTFKSPYIQGTVGDFNLISNHTDFARLNRKLQGITLNGAYKRSMAALTIATTRGYFNHVQFIGQEGNQGPYQLTGKNGERDIVVLAGTEKVWIDGRLMTRGESNDYVIEYGNGQLRFTTNRLITSASRIEVDFEYFPSVQKYNRSIYDVQAGQKFFTKRLGFGVNFYREADNPDQLLEQGGKLSAEERAILKKAGDDPLAATLSGARFDPGKGSYRQADTVFAGQKYSIYRYTGKTGGDYIVSFSDVGNRKGSYTRDRLGVYRWVGPNRGRFLPVRRIALPSKHNLADMHLNWSAGKYFDIQSEYALSQMDQNTFSSLDDTDNQGNALQIKGRLKRFPLKLNRLDLGTLDLNFNSRYVEENFRSPDRLIPPDYERYWNILPQVQQARDEKSFLFSGKYRPFKNFSLLSEAGQMQKTGLFSRRYSGQIAYGDSVNFTARLHYEAVHSTLNRLNITNDWQRYSARSARKWWKLRPEFSYKGEWRRNRQELQTSGFKYDDLGSKLGILNIRNIEGYADVHWRKDQVYDIQRSQRLIPQAFTTTERLGLKLVGLKDLSASLQVVHRNKDYTAPFEKVKVDSLKLQYVDPTVQDTTWRDRSTNLAQMNLNYNRWKKAMKFSWQYRVASQQAALKEKVYIDVGQGCGNLRFDEGLGEYVPDPDGSYLLFILPSGKFEPVTNLQTAWRLNLDPSRIWPKSAKGWPAILRRVSSESYFRVEEETREEDVASIYLLNLSKFQGKQTVRGILQVNQDLYLMRRNRKLSFRLRFRHRASRTNQFLNASENEDRLQNQGNLRMDWRVLPRLKSQTELGIKYTKRFSAANSTRNRRIDGKYLTENLSYRPRPRWESGLESEYGRETNHEITYPLDLWYLLLRGRLSYALPGRGRASALYQYQSVNIMDNPLQLTIPYEMARGKKAGISQTWQVRLEYTLTRNVLFTLFYSGRNEAGFSRVIHSGQAELRAYF